MTIIYALAEIYKGRQTGICSSIELSLCLLKGLSVQVYIDSEVRRGDVNLRGLSNEHMWFMISCDTPQQMLNLPLQPSSLIMSVSVLEEAPSSSIDPPSLRPYHPLAAFSSHSGVTTRLFLLSISLSASLATA